jgi:hypothetical protein
MSDDRVRLKLGKKPFVPDERDILYSAVRPKDVQLPDLPAGWGRGMDFKSDVPPSAGGWGMLGNGPCDDRSIPRSWAAYDGAGDCTCADVAHAIRMEAHDSGRAVPAISSRTVIEQYADLSGYNPRTGDNDDGLEIRDVLRYRLHEGFADDAGTRHKIGVYVRVDVEDWRLLREACWLFPGLSIGLSITQAQMDQFDANETWSYVPGSPDLGGHDVPIVGHPRGGLWTVISWGRRQIATYRLLEEQCDEVWAYVDPDRYSAVTGKTYNGYTDVDLEAYIYAVAGSVSASA